MPNSVMAKLLRILPAMRGSSHRFFCSGLPYRARTSVHEDVRVRNRIGGGEEGGST